MIVTQIQAKRCYHQPRGDVQLSWGVVLSIFFCSIFMFYKFTLAKIFYINVNVVLLLKLGCNNFKLILRKTEFLLNLINRVQYALITEIPLMEMSLYKIQDSLLTLYHPNNLLFIILSMENLFAQNTWLPTTINRKYIKLFCNICL